MLFYCALAFILTSQAGRLDQGQNLVCVDEDVSPTGSVTFVRLSSNEAVYTALAIEYHTRKNQL